MKKLITIPLLALAFTGCFSVKQAEIVTKDGSTNKTFSASGFFAQQALKGLNANSRTKETQTGLRLQSSDAAGDSDSISATGGLIGTAIGTALKTAK